VTTYEHDTTRDDGATTFASYCLTTFSETSHATSHAMSEGAGSTEDRVARSIIGPTDDRIRLTLEQAKSYPWRAICMLEIRGNQGERMLGTGWLAGPRLVVTAGHNVFNPVSLKGYARNVIVTAGRWQQDGAAAPLSATRLFVADGWRQKTLPEQDLGALLLPQDIGTSLGYFAYAPSPVSNAIQKGSRVTVCGYPEEDPFVAKAHAERLVAVSPQHVWYRADTTRGQSGSPVLIDLPGQAVKQAVAIHTLDETQIPSGIEESNQGVRITPALAALISQWRTFSA
jgi:V8-like Glu-specific endopeptidase